MLGGATPTFSPTFFIVRILPPPSSTCAGNGDIFIASCSQDTYIRLWRMSVQQETEEDHLHLTGNQLSLKDKSGKETCLTVSLEAVLAGHDDWVYSVHWAPSDKQANRPETNDLTLLSASMDKTMILWKVDPDSGVWMEQVCEWEHPKFPHSFSFYHTAILPPLPPFQNFVLNCIAENIGGILTLANWQFASRNAALFR